jgi:DUF1009 family protein
LSQTLNRNERIGFDPFDKPVAAQSLLRKHFAPVTGSGKTLGIIAGNRSLPFLLAREARAAGIRLVAAGFHNETDPALTEEVDILEWVKVGQLGKLIEIFKKHQVTQCVMVGQIAPKNLFDLRPDLRAVKLLWGLKEKNAHTIFGGIAAELEKDGITLIEATPWLRPHMPGPEFLLGPGLKDDERDDISFGFGIAKEVSRLEIGQLVVVKNGTVLAVEGFEGTDACLARGGSLAGAKGGAVAVKVARENHDFRFDIPCVGQRTIETCIQHGIRVLAIESEKTLLLEKDSVEQLARKHKISITTVNLKTGKPC